MAETASPHLGRALAKIPDRELGAFSRLAWGVTGYTWLVVLWGGIVRITGSGAGCGQHWPTCHGEVAHLPKTLETWIELGHRATSGLSFLAVLFLVVRAVRTFQAAHRVRRAALAALAFMLVEVLIGARLVLARLVGADASLDRALIMPIHLLTTSFLLGALCLSAWWSGKPAQPSLAASPRQLTRTRVLWMLGLAALGILAVSATGAITALGDTVFPVRAAPLADRLRADQSVAAHFLERLRVIHPVLAVGVAGVLLYVAGAIAGRARGSLMPRLKICLQALIWLQIAAGLVNVLLSAPGYLQVIHLAVAIALWLAFVLFAAEAWDEAQG